MSGDFPDGMAMEKNMQAIMDICKAVAQETNLERLLNKILDTAMEISNCRAGTLYFREGESLAFRLVRNLDRRDIAEDMNIPPVPVDSRKHLCSLAAIDNKIISIADAYACEDYDLSGTKWYDERNHYETRSVLVCPIMGTGNVCLSVLQLINAMDDAGKPCDFADSMGQVEMLADFASSALQAARFQSVVESMITFNPKTGATHFPSRESIQAHIDRNYYGSLSQEELKNAETTNSANLENIKAKSVRKQMDMEHLSSYAREYVQGKMSKPGNEILKQYMDERNMKQAELARRSTLDKGAISAMRSKNRAMSKNSVFSMAVAMALTLEETNELLWANGEAIVGSDPRDLVVEFCITFNEEHQNDPLTVDDVNEILYSYIDSKGEPLQLIGSIPK